MNNFPEFSPNQPALQQLTSNKLNLVSQGQKANQIQTGVGYRVTQTPGGTTVSAIRRRQVASQAPISWKLTVDFDDPDYKWNVSATNSSITEGTNGTAIDLSSGSSKWVASSPIKFDQPTTISATSWIILECAVDSGFALDDFTFKAVTVRADAQEVKFLTTGTLQQEKLRMLIGKIIFESGAPRAVQGEKSPQFVDFGILAFRAVKCYLPPQLDPSLLV